MIDQHPVLIARCGGVADVIEAVNYARNNNLPVGVRGGGHNDSNGVSPSGEPEFPDLVIGEWTCWGWFIGDGVKVAGLITRVSRAVTSGKGKLSKAGGKGTQLMAVDQIWTVYYSSTDSPESRVPGLQFNLLDSSQTGPGLGQIGLGQIGLGQIGERKVAW